MREVARSRKLLSGFVTTLKRLFELVMGTLFCVLLYTSISTHLDVPILTTPPTPNYTFTVILTYVLDRNTKVSHGQVCSKHPVTMSQRLLLASKSAWCSILVDQVDFQDSRTVARKQSIPVIFSTSMKNFKEWIFFHTSLMWYEFSLISCLLMAKDIETNYFTTVLLHPLFLASST